MGIFGDHEHSFEADITILPLGANARQTPTHNGIRWDFCYLEDLDDHGRARELFMIWPEFFDDLGMPVPVETPLQGRLHALMHVVNPEMLDRHRQRLKVESKFFCAEGSRLVAEGVVTSLSPMV